MILESYPWKNDLKKIEKYIKEYNLHNYNQKQTNKKYKKLEKCIFYSAFIIRKLIDCKSKLSNEADNYVLNIFSVKAKKSFFYYDHYIDYDSHDFNNKQSISILGKTLCNSLIHSFFFYIFYNEYNKIESFCVSSDFDKNKVLYLIPIQKWVNYLHFIITDDIISFRSTYNDKTKDYDIIEKPRVKT